MAVSKETIIDASIRILNREGVEKLSMRTLAKELGIKAASLYWHYSGKQELYGAIAEHMCAKAPFPETIDGPKGFVREVCLVYRAMLLTVRDSVEIFANSIPDTPRRVELIRLQFEALQQMGIQKERLMTAAHMVNNYVLSFTADECRFKNIPPEMLKSASENLLQKDSQILMDFGDYDESFLYGLEVLFSGFDAVR